MIVTCTASSTTYKNLDFSGYKALLVVAYYSVYYLGSTIVPLSTIAANDHVIVCFNDGTIRKGEFTWNSTQIATSSGGGWQNITGLKVYGI